jgi:hypothetical protein
MSKSAVKNGTNFGGSWLPSYGPDTYDVLVGLHGQLQVRPTRRKDEADGWTLLAMHPNGYSCKELAERIMAVWQQQRPKEYAMQQFQYILDCGGLGRSADTLEAVLAGGY